MINPLPIYRQFARSLSMTTVRCQPPSLIKLKKLQADFQVDDGEPIFLKRGLPDRILFSATVALCALGILMCVGVVYDNAKPTSWKTSDSC